MIPSSELCGSAELPRTATFWTPAPADISEEGFGFFRNTWAIIEVTYCEAWDLIDREQRIVTILDGLAADEEAFERLARAVEQGDDDAHDIGIAELDLLRPFMADDESSPLEGLEIGVAGLTYALSAAGMFPAASCRGHRGPMAWSHDPVVYVATDRSRAQALQPLVQRSRCGLDIDPARADLLVIHGSSILALMRLACLALEHHSGFGAPPKSRPA